MMIIQTITVLPDPLMAGGGVSRLMARLLSGTG
jgi:hypothetical protein